MKQTWKRIGSLLLTVCMVFTLLPTMAFAETGVTDSGTPLETSDEITAFGALDADIAAQTKEVGTAEDELKLPNKLAATVVTEVTTTGSDGRKETETIVAVERWTSDPAYDGDTAGDYVFIPTLELPEGLTLAEDVSVPTITVTVQEEPPALQARGTAMLLDDGTSVTTQEDLKTALASETDSTVTVTASFTLTEAVEVKANHTLIIDNGVTLTMGDLSSSAPATLTVSDGKILTVSGDGTLEVSNTTTPLGVLVMGSMIVSDGNLAIKNSGTNTNGIFAVGLLSVEDNSVLSVANAGENTGILGNVTIQNSWATISNTNSSATECSGIFPYALTIDNSTVTMSNGSSSRGILIRNPSVHVLLKNHAKVIAAGAGTGIFFSIDSGSLTVEDSILELQSGNGLDLSFPDEVSFTGLNSAIVRLAQGAEINSANGKMKDQGIVLTKKNVTVGAADATPSADSLTAGDYVWNGEYFAKGGGTPPSSTVTGTMNIGGETDKDLSANQSGTGWAWDAATATLTLDSSYVSSNAIFIDCATTDTINLSYSGNVNISVAHIAFNCKGALNIDGSGTLTLEDTTNLNQALQVINGDLNIIGGTLKATGPIGIASQKGDIIIGGSANVTAVSTGNSFAVNAGICANIGYDIIITGGTVNATGKGTGQYDGALIADNITITGGDVNLFADIPSNYAIADGGVLTISNPATVKIGGTPVYLATLTLSGVNTQTAVSAVTSLTSDYGIASMTTGADGKLYFLLPAGSQSVTLIAGVYTYTGTINVTNDHAATAMLTQQGGGIPTTASISGTVKGNDTNSGISGATVQLKNTSGGLLAELTTNASGQYSFNGLAIGTYRIEASATGYRSGTLSNIVLQTANISGKDITLTKISGDSENGSGSGGGSSSGGTTTPGKVPNQPITAAAPVTATADKNGAASAFIPEKSITDAIAKAQADAKSQGKTVNGTTVALNVTMPKGATALTATLTQSSLNSLVSAGVISLELNGTPVTISLDTKALAEIQKQSSGNISITIAPSASLSPLAKAMIGTRPVYDLTVSYTKDGKNATVSGFGGGTATIAVPYTPAKGEAVGGLYAVYVDAKGNASRIAGSAYDVNTGCVIFTTTHFSLYGIGYTAPSAKFTDIKAHWGKESIDYVVDRGLLSGTSETTFAPDTAMTRGMLVTALGRLAGVDVKAYTTNSFTDVKADSTFRPYIEWAYKKGVVQGTGNGKFEPDRAITREEIAVIFTNFAKATGYTLPATRTATTYADNSSIGSTYKTAVTVMQQAGIMMGGSGNKFNPKSSATRAEVSSMLHRYIKLTIDSDTALGGALNDAG